jgi:hypothetical protein
VGSGGNEILTPQVPVMKRKLGLIKIDLAAQYSGIMEFENREILQKLEQKPAVDIESNPVVMILLVVQFEQTKTEHFCSRNNR